jgi:hypothetical protein
MKRTVPVNILGSIDRIVYKLNGGSDDALGSRRGLRGTLLTVSFCESKMARESITACRATTESLLEFPMIQTWLREVSTATADTASLEHRVRMAPQAAHSTKYA